MNQPGMAWSEWNPADYAYHLSRRARGLPLWFSLATYGTDAYREAVEQVLALTRLRPTRSACGMSSIS
ncbi:MAG: hypothetical protein WEE66_07835 [Actinomycetota bacterium]